MADEARHEARQGGPSILQWLLGIAGTLCASGLITLFTFAVNANDRMARIEERLGQTESTQVIARGVIEREDVRDRDLHAELAKLRERVARLERDGGR
jgi:hypothetical protein